MAKPVILVATESDGTCSFCQAGMDNNCDASGAGRGYGRDGGLAPYMLIRNARPLIPLKTLDPVTAGPLADAGATSMHAVRRVLPRLGPGRDARWSSVPAGWEASPCSSCAHSPRRASSPWTSIPRASTTRSPSAPTSAWTA